MNYQLRTAYPPHMICSNLPISLYDTIELGPATMFLTNSSHSVFLTKFSQFNEETDRHLRAEMSSARNIQ